MSLYPPLPTPPLILQLTSGAYGLLELDVNWYINVPREINWIISMSMAASFVRLPVTWFRSSRWDKNLPPFILLLTYSTTERLCPRLLPNTLPWPMATLRSRWTTSSRTTHSNMAQNSRHTRKDPPSDRPLPRFRPTRRRCWNKMVIQIKGVGQDLQAERGISHR